MPASKKYSDEFRRHAVQMVAEISDEGVDQSDAVERVADLLSVPIKILRQWVDQCVPPPQPFDPTAIDDPYEAGVQLVEFGALDEAQSVWGAAEAGDTEAAFNLGVLLVRRGELDEAAKWWRETADAGDPDAAGGLGMLLVQRGELDESEAFVAPRPRGRQHRRRYRAAPADDAARRPRRGEDLVAPRR